MKKFRYIIMLLAIIGFTACDSDSIEGLKGEFSDILGQCPAHRENRQRHQGPQRPVGRCCR